MLNDAIIITEKVHKSRHHGIQRLAKAYICGQMKWVFNLLQVVVLGTIKLSVIFFYRRIFRGKVFDYYSRGMITVVSAWTTAFFFTVMFECGTHFEFLWSTLLNLLTHCTNDLMYLKAYSISDVITDGLILAMPIPVVCFCQTETILTVVELTDSFRYGDCRCRSTTNWLCALCSY